MPLNLTSKEGQVPEAERHIRTLKEIFRATWICLEYKTKLSGKFVVELVLNGYTWLKGFPRNSGVNDILETQVILRGLKMDFNLNCKISFGYYNQIDD